MVNDTIGGWLGWARDHAAEIIVFCVLLAIVAVGLFCDLP